MEVFSNQRKLKSEKKIFEIRQDHSLTNQKLTFSLQDLRVLKCNHLTISIILEKITAYIEIA